MRKNILFVFGILFLLIFSLFFVSGGRFFLDVFSPKNSVSSLEKGLVGHWTLDEINYNPNTNRVTDKSAYSNHGINSGATFTTDRMGNIGGAMSFDGSNDYIKIENTLTNNPSELTISGWVRKESGGGTYGCAFHQGSDSSIGNSAYWFGVDSTDYLTATIGARAGVGWSAGKTSIKVNYGEWYHLSAVWDGSIVKVYVNGDYAKQYSLGTYSTLTTPTRIGASTDGTTYQFKGNIDEVRIYERALSDEEIKLLYDSYKPKVVSSSLQSGLVLDMPLTDTYMKSSNIVTDRTPYSNDGTVNGAIVGSEYTSFDGINDYVIFSSKSVNLSKGSYSIWVRPHEIPFPSWDTIIHHETNSVNKNSIELMGCSGTEDLCFGFSNSAGSPLGSWTSTTAPNLIKNNWYHVVTTWDQDENMIRIYLNGRLEDMTSGTNFPSLKSENLGVGKNLVSGGREFKGDLSNLKIYNRALSEEEVKSLYERGRI